MSVAGAIPILRLGSTLLVTLHVELHDEIASQFQVDVLNTIQRTHGTELVIDISGLEMVDSYVARVLVETGTMASLMGARTVLVGMRPEVAATLVSMGYPMAGVKTALDLEAGLALLGKALVDR